MPVSEPTSATVTCHRCKHPFFMPHDVLRKMVDADQRPDCGCDNKTPYVFHGSDSPTALDHVLLAVYGLPGGLSTGTGVLWTDIVVHAWMRARQLLGLKGFKDVYPDSNRVRCSLCYLKDKGFVESPKPQHYRLTLWGQRRALKLIKMIEVADQRQRGVTNGRKRAGLPT